MRTSSFCAGDPDRDGVVLPLDVTEFELLAIFGCGELPPTPQVKRAWLHLAGTTELIFLVPVGKPETGPTNGHRQPVSPPAPIHPSAQPAQDRQRIASSAVRGIMR